MDGTQKIPLLGMTPDDLAVVAANMGLPRFAAKQIAQWIYEKHACEIDEMTNLSKIARKKLNERYVVGRTAPANACKSADGTVKYLFETSGGQMVESVFIPDADRATLCVSSQAGCKMGCKFCMTGKQGFHGNLSAAEILNQIFSIPESQSLTNIVFMGMGEPTDNLTEVLKAIAVLTKKWGLAWSPKRVTVSSVGKLPELKMLVEQTDVHIAVSLHSPFHDERASLMPLERAYPIERILKMLRNYDFSHQRRLSVEYIMWHRLNDDMRHADALAKLLDGMKARVNLIRFHAIPEVPLRTSDEKDMVAFRDRLNEKGILCTIRRSRGEDIMAACGMLAGKNLKHPQS